jgi:hypothetical protein
MTRRANSTNYLHVHVNVHYGAGSLKLKNLYIRYFYILKSFSFFEPFWSISTCANRGKRNWKDILEKFRGYQKENFMPMSKLEKTNRKRCIKSVTSH